MRANINSRIKPLFASYLRQNIGKYLISSHFDHFLIENNLDGLWEQSRNIVSRNSNVIIAIPGYTGDAEEAFGYYLENILEHNNEEKFALHNFQLLNSWADWKKNEINIQKIREKLVEFNISKDLKEELFSMDVIGEPETDMNKSVKLTPEIDSLEIDENLCFVLMPFDEKLESIYNLIIKPTVENSAKIKCIRADEIFSNTSIIDDIWKNIKQAKVLIADLTQRNPNVFYELGIAHAFKKEVILITQEIKDIPFDLRHLRCIVYQDSVAGSQKLRDGLTETLKAILN